VSGQIVADPIVRRTGAFVGVEDIRLVPRPHWLWPLRIIRLPLRRT